MRGDRALRLMPWSDDRGRPVYLRTDNPDGYLSRTADNVEETQIGMASDLLDHVQVLLPEGKLSADELRFFAARLCECLHQTMRIADSRGERLADAAEGEDTPAPQLPAVARVAVAAALAGHRPPSLPDVSDTSRPTARGNPGRGGPQVQELQQRGNPACGTP